MKWQELVARQEEQVKTNKHHAYVYSVKIEKNRKYIQNNQEISRC